MLHSCIPFNLFSGGHFLKPLQTNLAHMHRQTFSLMMPYLAMSLGNRFCASRKEGGAGPCLGLPVKSPWLEWGWPFLLYKYWLPLRITIQCNINWKQPLLDVQLIQRKMQKLLHTVLFCDDCLILSEAVLLRQLALVFLFRSWTFHFHLCVYT